jgi:hypothetical protein
VAKLVDVDSIITYFESLVDPRHSRNRKHLLSDIVVICVAAIICGCDGPTAIHRTDWLVGRLVLANGIPWRDCIRRLLIALKPEAFQQRFQDWIAQAMPADASADGRLIAIDGKTCRRSHDAARHLGPMHSLSAWASEEGLALGQVATEGKSNEITAMPELLRRLSLAWAACQQSRLAHGWFVAWCYLGHPG